MAKCGAVTGARLLSYPKHRDQDITKSFVWYQEEMRHLVSCFYSMCGGAGRYGAVSSIYPTLEKGGVLDEAIL
jgi:hypothetical protein